LSEELVERALEPARLRAAIRDLPERERSRLAEAVLDQLAEDREQLPEELNERLLDTMLGGLIAGRRGEREILGSDGLLGELTGRLVERALSEELTEHLGYPPGQAPPGGVGNARICRARHMRAHVAPKTMLR
jgi:hypothetical protein